MIRIARRLGLVFVLLAVGIAGFAWWYDHVGQHADPNFDPHVQSPAYPGGPDMGCEATDPGPFPVQFPSAPLPTRCEAAVL